MGEERGCVGRKRLGWLHGAVSFVPVVGNGGDALPGTSTRRPAHGPTLTLGGGPARARTASRAGRTARRRLGSSWVTGTWPAPGCLVGESDRFGARSKPTWMPRKAMSSASANPELSRDWVVGRRRVRVEMTGWETCGTRDGRRPAAELSVSGRPGCGPFRGLPGRCPWGIRHRRAARAGRSGTDVSARAPLTG